MKNIVRYFFLSSIFCAPFVNGQPSHESLPTKVQTAAQVTSEKAIPRSEVLRFLDNYRFSENVRRSYQQAVSTQPQSPKYLRFTSCVDSKLTNQSFEPLVSAVISQYMTQEQLTAVNLFLESEIGTKMLSPSFYQSSDQQQDALLTADEQAQLSKISEQRYFQAYASFIQKGLNTELVQKWEASIFQECRSR